MSRNGAGTYSLYAGVNPVVTGTTITSSWANNTLSDLATAMTASIANDGQTPILANLPMSGFRHTGVGNAANLTDYAAAGQVQNGAFIWGGTAGGSADALTISLSPSLTAYSTGQKFRFLSGASPSTSTTPTLNINGLGAKTIVRRDNSACVSGEIPASTLIDVVYDGTNFRLASAPVMGTSSITTLGTVTTGTWNATVIAGQYGGTGVANTGKTITLGGNISTGAAITTTGALTTGGALTTANAFTTSGNFALTLTTTNTTNVTLPTSGTLAVTTQALDTFGACTDVTTNNVSTTAHGLCPKLPNNTTTFLRGDGSFAAPAGSAYVFITSLTPTAAATLDLLNVFSATYDNYMIVGEGLTIGTTAQTITMRLATGGSADAGSNYFQVTATGMGTEVTATSTSVNVIANMTNGTLGGNFVAYVTNANDATRSKMITIFSQGQRSTTPGHIMDMRLCTYVATNTVSGIRLLVGSGNFGTTGKIYVWGQTNS
jgi:hypothetical protein